MKYTNKLQRRTKQDDNVEQVRQVGSGKVMEGFKGEQYNIEDDVMVDG